MVFTIVASCSACSPASAPAALTAAVVSMLPPIQAPATAWDRPSPFAAAGSRKIEGRANTTTRLAVYASCSRLAWTAPAAAIAALMPQIDTADDSSARSRSSRPSRPPSHQVNPNTTLISTSACTIAGPAAVRITAKLIDAPSSTSPVLMKNSVRNPPASRSRSPGRVSTRLPSRPSRIA